MIEIRPVDLAEEPQFLRLLCHLFDLDMARASAIFFAEPLHNVRTNWALFDNGEMVSLLTTTPLTFGFGNAIGISGVCTRPERRREGLGLKLLNEVLSQNEAKNINVGLLFAHRTELYEAAGFQVLDHVIRAPILQNDHTPIPPMGAWRVREIYDAWAAAEDNRLHRDNLRWKYWEWTPRNCEPVGSQGYVALEGSLVRELISANPILSIPAPAKSEWVGLESMTRALKLNLGPTSRDLIYMVRGRSTPPQMFMTDQF